MTTTGPSKTRSTSSRPLIARELVAVHKRRRLLSALAELIAAQGYEATSITDIVARAAIARKTLYDNFGGKDQLLLATIEDAIGSTLARVEAACAVEADWPERVGAGLGALLAELAEHPERVNLWLIVAPRATLASAQLHGEAMERFLALLRDATPRALAPAEPVEESVVGGVAWILHRTLRDGKADRAPDLLPGLSAFVLAAYGEDAAPASA